MNATVTIDKAGRVVIPKEIRENLRLEAGDELALESDDDHLTLRPIGNGARLRKERGIWVFYGGRPISQEEANREVRRTRERYIERKSSRR